MEQTNQLQRTDEWFADRLGKATASRFGDVLAKIRSGESAQRRNYRAQLVIERITEQPIDNYTSKEMQWGIETEAVARMEYELRNGVSVTEEGFMQHKKLMAGASPDGLVGKDGQIEIKCPNSATHIETLKRQDIPAQYIPQVQGQMWISGRKWNDFVSFDPRMPDNAQYFCIRVERDEDYIKNLEAEVAQFLIEVEEELQFIKTYGGVRNEGN